MTDYKFSCTFCDKKYVTEARYLKHTCTPMLRAEEIQTIIGQAAW